MGRLADRTDMTEEELSFWERFSAEAGKEFQTAKGLSFTYSVRGGEVFFSRKSKSVTVRAVITAYRTAGKIMEEEEYVAGPKRLGVFGAVYLFPVFLSLGVLTDENPHPQIAEPKPIRGRRSALPSFGPFHESVTKFGAKPDAGNVQTEKIQSAIDACFLAGGGTVTVPSGTFVTGGLRLRSGVCLYLEEGAVLRGTRDPEDYFMLENDTVEPVDPTLFSHDPISSGRPEDRTRLKAGRWHNGLIRALGAKNIAIIGEKDSVIDGMNCFDEGGEEHYRGPHGISIIDCENVLLRGFTVQNSGNWPESVWWSRAIVCENIVNLAGHDGFHMTSCDDVVVRHCQFYTGDDCIAGFDNRAVVVEDCVLNTACSAFRFGGTDVVIRRCRAFGPARYAFRGRLTKEEKREGRQANDCEGGRGRMNMLSFFTYYADYSTTIRNRPGNIVIEDCSCVGADRFLHFNYSGNSIWQQNRPLGDITFINVYASRIKMPLCCYGGEKDPVRITFANVHFKFAEGYENETFMHLAHFSNVSFTNVTVENNVSVPFIKIYDTPVPGELSIENSYFDVEPTAKMAEEPFQVKPI